MAKGWRSGAVVERKKLNQWFFNINQFAEDLLSNLETLKDWPSKVKTMQKNWIGKSFGCELNFKVEEIQKLTPLNVLRLDQIHFLEYLFLLYQ